MALGTVLASLLLFVAPGPSERAAGNPTEWDGGSPGGFDYSPFVKWLRERPEMKSMLKANNVLMRAWFSVDGGWVRQYVNARPKQAERVVNLLVAILPLGDSTFQLNVIALGCEPEPFGSFHWVVEQAPGVPLRERPDLEQHLPVQ